LRSGKQVEAIKHVDQHAKRNDHPLIGPHRPLLDVRVNLLK
jgi:hypothetical protein